MEWRLEERATGMEDKKEAGLCGEYLGRGKRWKWRRRCGGERPECGNGNGARRGTDRDSERKGGREGEKDSEKTGTRERQGENC